MLASRSSDHKPLGIRLYPDLYQRRPSKSFKFEACWNKDEECSTIIKSAWEGRLEKSVHEGVLEKLQKCKQALSSWSSVKFGSIGKSIKTLSNKLEQLQKREDSGSLG